MRIPRELAEQNIHSCWIQAVETTRQNLSLAKNLGVKLAAGGPENGMNFSISREECPVEVIMTRFHLGWVFMASNRNSMEFSSSAYRTCGRERRLGTNGSMGASEINPHIPEQ